MTARQFLGWCSVGLVFAACSPSVTIASSSTKGTTGAASGAGAGAGSGAGSGSGAGATTGSAGGPGVPCEHVAVCTEDPSISAIDGDSLVAPIVDYVALCNGQLLLAQKDTAAVAAYDIYQGQVTAVHALQALPSALAVDTQRGLLFVAEASLAQLERVDLASGATQSIPLPAPAVGLALGGDGLLFVSLDDAATAPQRQLAIVDEVAGTVDGVVTGDYGSLVAYDCSHGQLITAIQGPGPGVLRRHAFDPVAKTFVLTQERDDAGQDCRDLALSPDGEHLVYLCAGGNAGTGSVVDFAPADLSVLQGEWQDHVFPDFVADPVAAAFSPDSSALIFASSQYLFFLDVAMHAFMAAQNDGDCWAARGVRMSPYGKQVYALDGCPPDPMVSVIKADWIESG